MDKLIDLLNEYEIEKKKEIGEITYVWINAEGILFAKRHGINALSILETRAVLVNKEYGFIQRLVENDKIDYHKISDIMIYSQWRYTGINKTTAQRVDENMSDLLIMILAIEDNPISLLLSFLI